MLGSQRAYAEGVAKSIETAVVEADGYALALEQVFAAGYTATAHFTVVRAIFIWIGGLCLLLSLTCA